MADIYDLIQQGLAERRAGRSQFSDPIAEVAMQVPKWLASERDKSMVKENTAMADFASLIPLANTAQGIDNLQSQLNGLSVSSENKPKYDTLNNILGNRSAQYNAALPYIKEMYASYDAKDPKDDKYNWGVDDILNQNIDENSSKWLVDEIERTGLIINQLENAQSQGFNYNKTIGDLPLDQLLDKAKRHNGILKEVMKAAPGGINREEAVGMIFGDYGTVQTNKLAGFEKQSNANTVERRQLANFINKTNAIRENNELKADKKSELLAQLVGENLQGTGIDIDPNDVVAGGKYSEAIESARRRIFDIDASNDELERNKIFWGYTGAPDTTKSGSADIPTGLSKAANYDLTSMPISNMIDIDGDGTITDEEHDIYNDLLLSQPGMSFNSASYISDLLKNNPKLTTTELNEAINEARPKEILDDDDLALYNDNSSVISESERMMKQIEQAHETNQSIRPIGGVRLIQGVDTDGDGEISQEELEAQGALTYDEYKARVDDHTTANEEILGVTDNIMVNLATGSQAISEVSEQELSNLFNMVTSAWEFPEEEYGEIGKDIRDFSTLLVGLKGLSNADKVVAIMQTTGAGIVSGSKNIMTSFNISNAQVQEFLKDPEMDKILERIREHQRKADELKGIKNMASQRQYHVKEAKRIAQGQGKKWAKKWFGQGATGSIYTQKQIDDVARLFSAKEGPLYNIFNMRNLVAKDLPNILGKGAKGFGNFYLGSKMFDYAFGLDEYEYLQDHPLIKTGIELGGTLVAGKALKKGVWDKIVTATSTQAGRNYLQKKLGKKLATKIIGSVASGGGIFSFVTGVAGTAWSIGDIMQFFDEWDGDVSEVEIAETSEQPMTLAKRELLNKLIKENPDKDLSFFVSELNKAAPSTTATATKKEPTFTSTNYGSDPYSYMTPEGGVIDRTKLSTGAVNVYTDGKDNRAALFDSSDGKGYTHIVSSVSPVTLNWLEKGRSRDHWTHITHGDFNYGASLGYSGEKNNLPDASGETYGFLDGNPYEVQTFGTNIKRSQKGSYKEKYHMLKTPTYGNDIHVPFGELNIERHYDMYTNMDYNNGYNLNNESEQGIQVGTLKGENREAFQKKFNLSNETMNILDDIKTLKKDIEIMPATTFKEADKKYQKIKKLVDLKRKLQKKMYHHENNLQIKNEGIRIKNPPIVGSDGNIKGQYNRDHSTTKDYLSADGSIVLESEGFPSYILMDYPTKPKKSDYDKELARANRKHENIHLSTMP